MKYFPAQRRCSMYELDESAPLVWGVLDSKGGFRPVRDEQQATEMAAARNAAAEAAAALASIRSPARAAASAENGRAGGRPATAVCNCGAGDADGKQHRATCPIWKRAYRRWWREQRKAHKS